MNSDTTTAQSQPASTTCLTAPTHRTDTSRYYCGDSVVFCTNLIYTQHGLGCAITPLLIHPHPCSPEDPDRTGTIKCIRQGPSGSVPAYSGPPAPRVYQDHGRCEGWSAVYLPNKEPYEPRTLCHRACCHGVRDDQHAGAWQNCPHS